MIWKLMGTSTQIPPILSRSLNDGGVGYEDRATLWMDDAYLDFGHRDVENPPLEYHFDNIH